VFGEVEKEAMIRCEYCMPDEDDLPVYVCRDPRVSLEELWPQVKHYDQDEIMTVLQRVPRRLDLHPSYLSVPAPSNPASMARTAAWVLSDTPSLEIMC
jgi:hypothetical protein